MEPLSSFSIPKKGWDEMGWAALHPASDQCTQPHRGHKSRDDLDTPESLVVLGLPHQGLDLLRDQDPGPLATTET